MIDNDTCKHLILNNFLTSKTKISQKKKKKEKKSRKGFNGVQYPLCFFEVFY